MKKELSLFGFVTIIGIIALIQCNSNISSKLKIKELNIHTENFNDKLELSKLFSSQGLLFLETNDDCLINTVDKVVFYDNSIFILDKTSQRLLMFGADGSFTKTISKNGDGPGDFLEVADFIIDSSSNLIIVPDIYRVHLFDINGDFIKTIKTEFIGTHIIKSGKNEFAFYGAGRGEKLIFTDANFQVTNKYFEYYPLYRLDNHHIFSKAKNKILFHMSSYDSIFELNNNNFKTAYFINFNGKNYNHKKYFEKQKLAKQRGNNYFSQQSDFIRSLDFYPINDNIFLRLDYKGTIYIGTYNLKSNNYSIVEQSGLINDLFNSTNYFLPKGKWNDCYVFPVNASLIVNNFNGLKVINKRFEKSFNDFSNPVLLFLKPITE